MSSHCSAYAAQEHQGSAPRARQGCSTHGPTSPLGSAPVRYWHMWAPTPISKATSGHLNEIWIGLPRPTHHYTRQEINSFDSLEPGNWMRLHCHVVVCIHFHSLCHSLPSARLALPTSLVVCKLSLITCLRFPLSWQCPWELPPDLDGVLQAAV